MSQSNITYTSLAEAWGTPTSFDRTPKVELVKTRPTTPTTPDELLDLDLDVRDAVIPAKITAADVKAFVTKAYKKGGIKEVERLLPRPVTRAMCRRRQCVREMLFGPLGTDDVLILLVVAIWIWMLASSDE